MHATSWVVIQRRIQPQARRGHHDNTSNRHRWVAAGVPAAAGPAFSGQFVDFTCSH